MDVGVMLSLLLSLAMLWWMWRVVCGVDKSFGGDWCEGSLVGRSVGGVGGWGGGGAGGEC